MRAPRPSGWRARRSAFVLPPDRGASQRLAAVSPSRAGPASVGVAQRSDEGGVRLADAPGADGAVSGKRSSGGGGRD